MSLKVITNIINFVKDKLNVNEENIITKIDIFNDGEYTIEK